MKRLLLSVLLLTACAVPLTAQDIVRLSSLSTAGVLTTSGDVLDMVIPLNIGFGSVGVEARGTWTGTVQVECIASRAGGTHVALILSPRNSTTTVTTFTANGQWSASINGCQAVRARATAAMTGAVTVTMVGSFAGGSSGGGGGGGGSVTQGTDPWIVAGGGTAGTAATAVVTVQGIAGGTAIPVTGATGTATTDADDASIAVSQTNSNVNALNMAYDGTVWRRLTFGVAGTASAQVLTVQGVASMTPILATVTASNLDVQIGGSDTLTVASHAVTNAGTFATQVDGAALTALQLIDNLPNTLGSTTSGQSGALALAAVTTSAPSYTNAQTNALSLNTSGELRVAASGITGGTALADDADFTAGTTSFTPVGGFYQSSVTACTDGDTCAAGITVGRAVKVALTNPDGTAATYATDGTFDSASPATGPAVGFRVDTTTPTAMADGDLVSPWATTTGALYGASDQFEDIAETAGTPLAMVGSVRRDTAATSAGSTGENATINTDANGRLYTNTTLYTAAGAALTPATDVVEDAPETAAGTGPMVLSVRRDVPASSAGTTGDNATVNTSALGALWTATVDPCSYKAKSYYVLNTASAATVEIANAVASEFWYICSVNLVAGAAQTIAIATDDTDGCGSLTAGLHGGATAATGWSFAANGGIALGNGNATVLKSATANHYFCFITGQATQISGTIAYVSAP